MYVLRIHMFYATTINMECLLWPHDVSQVYTIIAKLILFSYIRYKYMFVRAFAMFCVVYLSHIGYTSRVITFDYHLCVKSSRYHSRTAIASKNGWCGTKQPWKLHLSFLFTLTIIWAFQIEMMSDSSWFASIHIDSHSHSSTHNLRLYEHVKNVYL